MGRILKRVPLDFDYPLSKTWKGYLNPYYVECPYCRAGWSNAYWELHELIQNLIWKKKENKELIQITSYLCGRSSKDRIFGHDSIDISQAVRKLGRLAKLDKEWIRCKECNGSGIDKEYQKLYDEWKEYDPPKGEGVQLWSNTGEGMPISPVFETLEKLCEWAEINATTFASYKATKEEWFKMLSDGFVSHQEGNMIFM